MSIQGVLRRVRFDCLNLFAAETFLVPPMAAYQRESGDALRELSEQGLLQLPYVWRRQQPRVHQAAGILPLCSNFEAMYSVKARGYHNVLCND